MSMRVILFLTLFFSVQIFADDYVIIGDSHSCGSFGKNLADQLISQGEDISLYCAVSSAPQHWLRGVNPKNQKCKVYSKKNPQFVDCRPDGKIPLLDSILLMHPRSHLIVALGTNSLLDSKADSSYSVMSEKLNSRRCYWIGPPHLNPSQSKGFPAGRVQQLENNLFNFYESLKVAVGQCQLIDSRSYTKPGTIGNATTDGVHRTNEAGRLWSFQILEQFLKL